MPVGTITTQFLIGGQLLPSFMSAMTKANKELVKLARTTAQSTSSLSFLAKGVGVFAGLTAAAAAAAKIGIELGKVFGEAIALGNKQQNLIEALGVELQNTNRKLGLNKDAWKEMTDIIVKQSYTLEQQSGIYHQVYLQSAATLGTYHLSAGAISEVLDASKDLFAIQRMRGKSEEDLLKTADAVGKAFMGQPRGLKAVGIELDEVQQRIFQHLAALGYYKEAIMFLTNQMRSSTQGGAETWKKTPQGQAAIAFIKWEDALDNIKQPLIDVNYLLQEMIYTLGASIFGSPEMADSVKWLDEQITSLQRMFTKALPKIEEGIRNFMKGFNEGWKQAFGVDFNTAVKIATDYLKKEFKIGFDYVANLNWKDIGKDAAQTVKDFVDEIAGAIKDIKAVIKWIDEHREKKIPDKPSWMPDWYYKWAFYTNQGEFKGPTLTQAITQGQWKGSEWEKWTNKFMNWWWDKNPNREAGYGVLKSSFEPLQKSIDNLNATIKDSTSNQYFPSGLIYRLGEGGLGYKEYSGKGEGSLPQHVPYKRGASPVDVAKSVIGEIGAKEGFDESFDPGTNRLSIAGLWKGAGGLEGWGYNQLHNMTQAQRSGPAGLAVLRQVWGNWAKPTGVGQAKSPGLQEMIIADVQHWGGGKSVIANINRWVAAQGGWNAINAGNPEDIIHSYARFRRQFWRSNQYQRSYDRRMQEEEDWATKHARAGSAPVTINYNVHHHGGSDPHRLAEFSRQDLLRLKEMVEDVVYDRNRRAYVPRAV